MNTICVHLTLSYDLLKKDIPKGLGSVAYIIYNTKYFPAVPIKKMNTY